MPPKKKPAAKQVATLRHDDAKRKNLPTAEYEPLMRQEDKSPVQVAYARRNADLDPQFVWRGKDSADWSDLVVPAPPLYIQEKVHPKVLIDDLARQSQTRAQATAPQIDLFADFNGLPKDARATEFYQHDAHWTNRMILGDSLQVMASLAEREGLRGKVQCIYFDPPYGIKFNSNFQWSTTSRDVKDGSADHITREPEQVKAFRDTWRDGIHSYLTYLRDRLTVARDLLADSGSIFVQIGDENVHRARGVMDEVFGEENYSGQITVVKTAGQSSELIAGTADFVLWYAKQKASIKFRNPLLTKGFEADKSGVYKWVREPDGLVHPLPDEERAAGQTTNVFAMDNISSQRPPGDFPVQFCGRTFGPGKGYWKTGEMGMGRLIRANRIGQATNSLRYIRFLDDFRAQAIGNVWNDTGTGSFTDEKIYVVQSGTKLVQRCLLMTTDPGDLVLDPTCGSGTTAYVAEQWGRRWITIDTSRVALALARARIMGARYPFYLLADTLEGRKKELEAQGAALSVSALSLQPSAFHHNLRHGFVYERVPHITLKAIANNAEIDVIWDKWQQTLAPLAERLKAECKGLKEQKGAKFQPSAFSLQPSTNEWEIPREADPYWPDEVKRIHAAWWAARIARQQAIDASIAAKAEFEFLYDKPYTDTSKVRVAGPFTVESVSPHRTLTVDEHDNIVDGWKLSDKQARAGLAGTPDFAAVILENLKLSGVQQAHKADRLTFTSLVGWPGEYIGAEGRYFEGAVVSPPSPPSWERAEVRGQKLQPSAFSIEPSLKRAAIFIGPEFGTVSRPDLVAAAREAADAGFDILIACAFNYDAHSAEFEKLGRIPVLKARMNPDLHMAGELKNTGTGNLFVVFGEPDIELRPVPTPGRAAPPRRPAESPTGATASPADSQFFQIEVKGVDVFKPQTGEVVSAGPDGIACWFIDTDYNEESFFVRHAYFLGQNDPYQALKTTLKAEIDAEAWESLHSAISRPFPKPTTGRIAVKVINHLGDEVMKVFAL